MWAVDIVFAFRDLVCCDDLVIKDSRKISKALAVFSVKAYYNEIVYERAIRVLTFQNWHLKIKYKIITSTSFTGV